MKKIVVGLIFILSALNMIEVKAKEFSDVENLRWSYKAIESISDKGLVNGYPDGTFKPERVITRAEAAVILNNYMITEGKISKIYENNSFSDIAKTDWYYQAVNNTAGEGIFSGDMNGKFNPNATLTRAEMAAVINRINKYTIKTNYKFPDVKDTDWFSEDVKACYSNGIISGIKQSNGSLGFKATNKVTREQLITVLNNVYNYDENFEAKEIPTISTSEEEVKVVLEKINQMREGVGAGPVAYDKIVSMKVAQIHAEDMAKNSYFSLNSPISNLWNDRFYSADIYPNYYSIVIGCNDGKSESTLDIINSLIDSEQYKIIVDPKYASVGIGWCKIEQYIYITLDFYDYYTL